MNSAVSCFTNNTQIILGIKDEVDTNMLQYDLHKLCVWAGTNIMKSNANKLKFLQYRKKMKQSTNHMTIQMLTAKNRSEILGIMMCNRATFTLHIRNIVKRGQQQGGWCGKCSSRGSTLSCWHSWSLLSFLTRVLLPALKSMEGKGHWPKRPTTRWHRQAVEAVQWTFINKFTEAQHLNSWERLHKLKWYSL